MLLIAGFAGWWGVSRHVNYLGDFLQAFALGASCGSTHLLPWYYFLFLTCIFINRIPRDEARCRGKYGRTWERYCEKVRWRVLPGVL